MGGALTGNGSTANAGFQRVLDGSDGVDMAMRRGRSMEEVAWVVWLILVVNPVFRVLANLEG